MSTNTKQGTPVTKAEALEDAELDQVAGGAWGLESNFVKAPAGDSTVTGSAQPNGGIIEKVTGSASPNGGKTTT